MPKKAKKASKKAEADYTDITVYEEEGWHVSYLDLNGQRRKQKLDAETLGDAKFEVSHLLDVPEERIGS